MTLWQQLIAKLQESLQAYLLTVVDNQGSSPGRKGFKMVVTQDGDIFGSVGGGVMETTLVREAQQLLLEQNLISFIKRQIHRGHIQDGSGMICSGEQTVAFQFLDSKQIPIIQDIINCINDGAIGTLTMASDSFSFSKKRLSNAFHVQIKSKKEWKYEEHIGCRETLYIIGAGHVGLAVSEILAKLNFHVILIDNRKDLNTYLENKFAEKKLVIDYNSIQKVVPQEADTYVAIMTNKYLEDKLVLSKLIKNNYKYIGVLGSKAKIKTLWKELIQEGISREELNQIHAPIGLSIKSETPTEIAISIAAELIAVRNKRNK